MSTSVPASEIGSKVSAGAIAAVIRLLVVMSSGFIAAIMLAHKASPAVFGVYTAVYLTGVFVLYIFSGGFMILFVQKRTTYSLKDVHAVAWLSSAMVLVIGAIVVTGVSLLTSLSPEFYLLIWASLVITFLRLPGIVVFQQRIQLARYAWTDSVEVVVFQVCAVYGIYKGWGVESFAYALLASVLVAVLIANIIGQTIGKPSFARMKELLNDVKYYFTTNLFLHGKEQATAPTLTIIAGSSVAGIFQWGFIYASAFIQFANALVQSFYAGLPHRQNKNVAELGQLAGKLHTVIVAVVGTAVIITACVFAPLSDALFSQQWQASVPVFYVLSVASLITLATTTWVYVAIAEHQVKIVSRWYGQQMVVLFTFGMGMAVIFGAFAFAICYLAATIIMYYRVHDWSRSYFPGHQEIEKVTVLFMSKCIGTMLVFIMIVHRIDSIVLACVVGCVGTFIVLLATNWKYAVRALGDGKNLLAAVRN